MLRSFGRIVRDVLKAEAVKGSSAIRKPLSLLHYGMHASRTMVLLLTSHELRVVSEVVNSPRPARHSYRAALASMWIGWQSGQRGLVGSKRQLKELRMREGRQLLRRA
jgi:hypothetical protein